MRHYAIFFILLLSGASRGQPTSPAPCPPSQVLSFKRTAVMDTVTAVLDGQISAGCPPRPLRASVILVSAAATYRVMADAGGTFHFLHIRAGNYLLTATAVGYCELTGAHVHLGTGDAAEIKLRLASTNQ